MKEDFEFCKRIEEMSNEELEERIQKAYDYPLPQIRAMPYVGEECTHVEYNTNELVALCPMTGIQDLYTLNITLTPDQHIPELKSLKFYLLAYKDLPISHEHLCSRIKRDLEETLSPAHLHVHLDTAVRGGIKTIIDV